MKRILAVFLVVFVLLSSTALAAKHIYNHYTLFIDGEFYNSFFKAGFNFDTQMFDFYLYDNFHGGLFCKEEWSNGVRSSTGFFECVYTNNHDDTFSLSMDNGQVFNGYWDENGEDLWLCLGGKSYFRFCPVHSFDIQKDMVNK